MRWRRHTSRGGHSAQAFGEFYRKAFAAQGLLVLDAAGREVHRLGAPVLRAAIERADELHAALLERNNALEAAGYHAQVAVAPQSSLLFLIDERNGARMALKRTAPSAAEPGGLWQAGREKFTTADLLGILAAEPERISPCGAAAAGVSGFPAGDIADRGRTGGDCLFCAVGGAVRAHSGADDGGGAEAFRNPDRARHRGTAAQARVGLERVFKESADSLAQLLAARAMPVEGKRKVGCGRNGAGRRTQAADRVHEGAWMQAWGVRQTQRRARCATR